jgi:hypothetical protein
MAATARSPPSSDHPSLPGMGMLRSQTIFLQRAACAAGLPISEQSWKKDVASMMA